MTSDATSVGTVLDRLPLGQFHRIVLTVTGLTWALAAFEVLLISFTLSQMSEAWGLTGSQAGALGSASLIGMVIGSWAGGWLADQVGRVPALQSTVLSYAITTGLTALAVGFWSALLLRIVAGVGIGGTATVATAYLSEHLPTDRRGSYLTYLDSFWALGTVVAVIAAWLFLAQPVALSPGLAAMTGWRLLFIVGTTPMFLVPLLGRFGETPYHLVEHGRADEARDRIQAIAQWNDTNIDLSATEFRVVRRGGPSSLGRLASPDIRVRLLVISIAWFGANFGFYGVFIWLPSTIGAADLIGGTYRYLLLAGLVQVPGYLSAAYFVDRVGRKTTLGMYLLLSGIATYLFAATVTGISANPASGIWPFLLGLLAASFFSVGSFGALRAYTPELFPTEVRGLGSGAAEGSGRIAGVLGPIVAGALVESGYVIALTPLAIGFAIGGIIILLFGVETLGQSLE